MATAAQPRPAFNRADADRKVRHPLQAIRGYIRTYVLVEGAALTLLYVLLCFWLGLLVDYLPWKAFAFDWLWTVDDDIGVNASRVLRAVVLVSLVLGLVGIVLFKVVRRFFRDFSDQSVALLLERRYPNELGDRLITAVELADPALSKKYGYSQAMVDKTIADAAERVQKLPISEIFRWGRLVVLCGLALFVMFGFYIGSAIGYCTINQASPVEFFTRFNHTASIWAERNLLMEKSYWPPSTYLDLVRFSEAELRVPRDITPDDPRTDVKVRAVKWAIADQSDKGRRGWRALEFDDLQTILPADMIDIDLKTDWPNWVIDLDDLDPRVPTGVITKEFLKWDGKSSGFIGEQLNDAKIREILNRDMGKKKQVDAATGEAIVASDKIRLMLNWKGWTLDKLELQLDLKDPAGVKAAEAAGLAPSEVAKKLQPVASAMKDSNKAAYDKFLKIFEKLEELSEEPSMGRTLRKMNLPTTVVVNRKSESGRGVTNCQPLANRKFLFPVSDLKESCSFTIEANDYTTPRRKVTLLAPPMIDDLQFDKEEPAYFYFRTKSPDDDFLKGKFLSMRGNSAAVTGPQSTIIVKHGSNITLIGHMDRPLKDVLLTEIDAEKRNDQNSVKPGKSRPDSISDDRRTFSVWFGNVVNPIEFDFAFKDDDDVKATRRVLIVPTKHNDPKIKNVNLVVTPREVPGGESGGLDLGKGPFYLITPDAFLNIVADIEDDHGITSARFKFTWQEIPFQPLEIEVPKETSDPKKVDPKKDKEKEPEPPAKPRKANPQIIVDGLTFGPGPFPYPLFAAAYYGVIGAAMPSNDWKHIKTVKAAIEQPFESDVDNKEVLRLMLIKPDFRAELRKAIIMKSEGAAATKDKFVDFIKTLDQRKQTRGFLYSAIDFAFLDNGDESKRLQGLVETDPAEVLSAVVNHIAKTPEAQSYVEKLLNKKPQDIIRKNYSGLLAMEQPIDRPQEDREGNFVRDSDNKIVYQKAHFGFDLKEAFKTTNDKGDLVNRLKAAKGALQLHYGIKLTIEVTNNNVETGPGSATHTFSKNFLIVEEDDIQRLMMADQRKYYKNLNDLVLELEKKRDRLVRQTGDYEVIDFDPLRLQVVLDDARRTMKEGTVTVKILQGKIKGLVDEMVVNRFKKDRIKNLRNKVYNPLEDVNAQDVYRVEKKSLVDEIKLDWRKKKMPPDIQAREFKDLDDLMPFVLMLHEKSASDANIAHPKSFFGQAEMLGAALSKELQPSVDLWEKGVQKAPADPLENKKWKALRSKQLDLSKGTVLAMNKLIGELKAIAEAMRSNVTNEELLETLMELYLFQRDIERVLREYHQAYNRWILLQLSGEK